MSEAGSAHSSRGSMVSPGKVHVHVKGAPGCTWMGIHWSRSKVPPGQFHVHMNGPPRSPLAKSMCT
eukprot:1159839-Pelagomonas_calceolata.AAC.1